MKIIFTTDTEMKKTTEKEMTLEDFQKKLFWISLTLSGIIIQFMIYAYVMRSNGVDQLH